MNWVIQNNLISEDSIRTLIELLIRYDVKHTLIKVIPFGGGIETDSVIDNNENIVVIGSQSLVKYAKKENWKPGAWINENFNYQKQIEVFGDSMLNSDSVFCKFSDVPSKIKDFEDTFFIRPVEDGKEFSGTLFTKKSFYEWYKLIVDGDTWWTVNSNSEVMVSEEKNIYAEYRCIVIKNKIITSSQYKLQNTVIYDSHVPSNIIDFAQSQVDVWTPDDVFVLDVALTNKGLKIIEINNFNSAGWYNCDVSKIIQSIEEL